MLLDPKIYGEIDANGVDWKGYNLSFFKQTLVGRVLTTEDNMELLRIFGQTEIYRNLIVLPRALPGNRAFGSFTFVVLNLNPVSCQETCNCDFLLASVNIPLDVTPHSIANLHSSGRPLKVSKTKTLKGAENT
ncbi:hypothetical protein DAPPUDRAFT_317805 [Daphnia pulex]|uniref:Uncharacterized protein n=1 Tax=Daphnia pulex TaxID=6669 RepID=E9GH12_DAPPU|nr:hypothetical protein DAPPUDRAFT_317805 [Daphnia pulex]|eukprot:EFX81121.1 hypothetical protein DAPPUDRAFT_317805 [Daphnia pulex]